LITKTANIQINREVNMGCGAEHSNWDKAAMEDSMAGKNTGLNPINLEKYNNKDTIRNGEVNFIARYRDEALRKISGFENIRNSKGGIIPISGKDIAQAIAVVQVMRETVMPAISDNILSIDFVGYELAKEGGRSIPTKAG
jgi:hypothetical protein